MRSLTPDRTRGSASLANPGSTPLTNMETPAFSAAAMTGAASGSSGAGYCNITGLEDTTLMPAARKRSRSDKASKIRSSAMAVCTMQSGSRSSNASTSLVAVTPNVASSPASSPASCPTLSGLET